MKKYYNLGTCENLMTGYVSLGGYCNTIIEGSLGLGTVVLHGAKGKKSIIIQEVFLNEWSSAHTIRKYNKLPKKYAKAVQ